MLRLTPCQRGRCFYWCLMEHGSCDAPSGVSGGNGDNYRAGGGIQRGTGVPLCVVVGGGFLRGRGSRNTLPLKRVFGYFLHEQKVTRGVGLEAPSGFGKKHVSFPPRSATGESALHRPDALAQKYQKLTSPLCQTEWSPAPRSPRPPACRPRTPRAGRQSPAPGTGP